MERKAERKDWKIKPEPLYKADLGFTASYSADEFEKLTEGLIPKVMEDKWFIFYDNDWLYFHRGWTGEMIYWLRFKDKGDGKEVAESWVNRDKDYYREDDVFYDRELLSFLINALLLGRDVPFPLKGEVFGKHKGLIQHSITGTSYPEKNYVRKKSDN